MKILRVFSNKNFTNVKFDKHFNVVLATIHDKDNKKDVHNLGKTSLIHVINFLLLGKFSKDKGLLSNKIFQGQIFYLEIKLNDGNFLVIRRYIDSPTKISFKINTIELHDFVYPSEWDEEDLSFSKAKQYLNSILGFNVLNKWDFRKSITYFLRTQQDFLDVFQLNKFRGKHIDWKPFVFELLGFNGDLVEEKFLLEQEAQELKKKIESIQQEANIDINEKDKILGLIDIRQREKDEAVQTIDKFNFFLEDNSITKELIEELDFKIQTLNTDRYRISYEISKTEESLSSTTNDVDVSKLKKLYNDVELYLPELLSKQYEELEQFNKSISEERHKYLLENLTQLKNELDIINTSLESLENSKSDKLSFLTERDSYSKFKTYQKQLSSLEADIERLNEKLKLIDKTAEIEEDLKGVNERIETSVLEIADTLKDRKHAEINRIFNSILTDVVGTNALLSIKQNKQGNVEFSADYVNANNRTSTSESEGTSYKKLLCMAFDLSLLIFYSKNSFFRFAYHDGILEGLDDRIKIRLLSNIKLACKTYDVQHIITLIDSDIPMKNDGSFYQFENREVCLELNDLNDNGKLFKQSF